MGKVVVLGSANMDVCFRVPHIPLAGESLIAREQILSPGGKGANQAVAAARLGAQVHMIGRVGADSYGDALLASMRGAGVSTDFVVRDAQKSTGTAFINIADSGQNNIVVNVGANYALDEAQLLACEDIIAAADVFVLQLEVPLQTVIAALHMAKRLGVYTVLNPAPMRQIPMDMLSACDVLVPNETELFYLMGSEAQPEDAQVRDFAAGHGVAQLILTAGSEGCYLINAQGTRHFPTRSVRAVDTTGAGDCFIGALATRLCEGADMAEAIRFANAAAGLSVTRMGAQQGMPTRAEVEALPAM